jgi:hypothetical protein
MLNRFFCCRVPFALCSLLLTVVTPAIGHAGSRVTEATPENCPLIKDFGLKNYVRTSKDLPHVENAPWKLVCALPYNCHFQLWIEVEASTNAEIRFDSSNPLVRFLVRTETCQTEPGQHTYEAKKWVSGEGAIYTIPAGVKVMAVKFRETGYDTAFAGSFECNDEDYNILWKKAARTAYLCMRDHFYDCPDRERSGYWGDGTPELNQCFYIFDARAHELAKRLAQRQLEPAFYPGQHLEFLGEYGLWFYYLQTGDTDTLKAVYDQTKTFLLETYKSGNPRTWFDWGKENKDTAVMETCFMFIDLKSLRQMAEVTGHSADLPLIDARLKEIATTFDQKYWRGNFYRSDQVREPDDRANAMAVNAGLADPGKWPAIYENVLTKQSDASCFFDRWVFEALCKMGHPDTALLRMYNRYQTMIPCSFTTLWEHYDRWWASRKKAFDDASSLNHGWNPPALLLSQSIAGISPETPGWSTYHVLPQEAFLTSIKCIVPSIKGDVTVAIEKSKSRYSLRLTSPANTTAIVGIPKRAFAKLKTIEASGVAIWNGAYQNKAKGISWNGEDADYIRFNVAPGQWTFDGLGDVRLDCPKTPARKETPATSLDKKNWTATASVTNSVYIFSPAKIPVNVSPANALDGDHWTGWRNLSEKQHPGQWFQVDMQREQKFSRIVLDNTWALWDSPAGYAVTVSQDGEHWSEPVATGTGKLGITDIRFPEQKARYLHITQTGSNPTYHWSIYELDVYR